eukprot:CAMPEP_0179081628 /NCGR_PEP_ID=MMETSP0796-20121207/36763_1 /TAXON_ID=73915 /ORGANISM="Pyrodinium bahamense, Strain pbaha01" /LENGTH=218 /DNA_ID=CAMNT_0020779015 /DNA_START=38 /DNA_END=694 /DNA_ORIENTATION=-
MASTEGAHAACGRTSRVLRVCLSGGPCGGKTSSLHHLQRELVALGFDAYIVPEVATIMFQGGCQLPTGDARQLFDFELRLLQLQLQMEASFLGNAESTGRVSVVLFDRGVCDIAAYIPGSLWAQLLDAVGLDQNQALGRYDLVLHLRSASHGAEAVYTAQRPLERFGLTAADARDLDDRTSRAWDGHPRRIVLDNSTGFTGKLRRLLDAVAQAARQFL